MKELELQITLEPLKCCSQASCCDINRLILSYSLLGVFFVETALVTFKINIETLLEKK